MSNSYTGREIKILKRGGTAHDWQKSVSGAKINVKLIVNKLKYSSETTEKSLGGLYTLSRFTN